MFKRSAQCVRALLPKWCDTSLVDLHWLREEEVLVTLDPDRVAALGLTADEVSASIRAADAKVRAGWLRGDATHLVLGITGEITSLDRMRAVVIREDASGRVTLLGEMAQITRGPRLPLSQAALYQGQSTILISAKLSEGLQVDPWMVDIRTAVTAWGAALHWGLSIETVFDQTTRRYQSGEVDCDGHISRRGDAPLRGLLFEAATVVLTRTSAESALRTWG